jgi:hypothetical protein
MKDRSTSVGGRRSKAGNDATAGNSSQGATSRSFSSSKTVGVAKQNKRFAKTRTRGGKSNAI